MPHEWFDWLRLKHFYHSPTGPWVSGAFPDYVGINLPKLLISKDKKLSSDKPRTLVIINMAKFQYEKH